MTTINRITSRAGWDVALTLFKRRRNVYLYVVTLCVLFMGIYSLIAPNVYTAKATLFQRDLSIVNQNTIGSSLSTLLGSPQAQTPLAHYVLAMTSRPVAKMMIERQGLDKILFSSQWDAQTNSWHHPPGILSWIKRSVRVLFGLPAWAPPDEQNLADLIQRDVDISYSQIDGTLELSYDNKNPKIAAFVLSALCEDTSAVIQADEVAALKSVYGMVAQQLSDTNNVTLRDYITGLAGQTLQGMVQAGAKSAEVGMLNPVRVSPLPTSPRPILNFFIGILIAAVLIGGWHLFHLVRWIIRSKLDAA